MVIRKRDKRNAIYWWMLLCYIIVAARLCHTRDAKQAWNGVRAVPMQQLYNVEWIRTTFKCVAIEVTNEIMQSWTPNCSSVRSQCGQPWLMQPLPHRNHKTPCPSRYDGCWST